MKEQQKKHTHIDAIDSVRIQPTLVAASSEHSAIIIITTGTTIDIIISAHTITSNNTRAHNSPHLTSLYLLSKGQLIAKSASAVHTHTHTH